MYEDRPGTKTSRSAQVSIKPVVRREALHVPIADFLLRYQQVNLRTAVMYPPRYKRNDSKTCR